MGRKDLEGEMLARQAFQSSTVGLYNESMAVLELIDESELTKEGMVEYYNAKIHLYHELAYYTNLEWLKQKFKKMEYALIDSLPKLMSKTDPIYYKWMGFYLYDQKRNEESLKLFTEWVNSTKPNSHEFAIAAFYMFLVHSQMKNEEERKYWLIVSAISDIRNSIRDQGSLWTLAEILVSGSNDEAEVQRAHKYINYSWDMASAFGTRVRSSQISPILTMVETIYQTKIKRQNTLLTVAVAVVTLLMCCLWRCCSISTGSETICAMHATNCTPSTTV